MFSWSQQFLNSSSNESTLLCIDVDDFSVTTELFFENCVETDFFDLVIFFLYLFQIVFEANDRKTAHYFVILRESCSKMQVIVTIRILSWSLLSLGAFLLMLVALFSPAWLVGPALTVSNHNKTAHHHVSVGVYAKCGRPIHNGVLQKESCTTIALHGFAADSEIYPNVWKASMFFIAFGLSVMTVAVLSAFFSLCVQSICRKSIYTLLGVTQAFAGKGIFQ